LNAIRARPRSSGAGGNRDLKERRSQIEIVPAGGTSAANVRNEKFGTFPF
jgi:hypothetical protein